MNKKYISLIICLCIFLCLFFVSSCSLDSNKNIDVRVSGEYIQWSYSGENTWRDIISVDEVKDALGSVYKGDKGDIGVDGKSVEFQVADNYLQWHYVGDDDWINLLSLDDLKCHVGSFTYDNPQELDFYPLDNGTYGVAIGNSINLSTVVIPSSYKGKAVTQLIDVSYDYFTNNDIKIKKVVLPNSITYIGENAFFDFKNLEEIDIPYSVTYIGYHAFHGCTNLHCVKIANESVSIDSSGDGAFAYCDLHEVYLPSLSLWPNIYMAFQQVSSLMNFYINNEEVKNLVIPSTFTIINDGLFRMWAVSSVSINEGVESIGKYAFSGCSNLTNISIPNSINQLGTGAFGGCDNLIYNIYDNGKYLGNSNNPYLVFVKTINEEVSSCIINENTKFVIQIGSNNITSIVIPNSVVSINRYCFSSCTSLQSIVFGNGIDKIYYEFFNSLNQINYIIFSAEHIKMLSLDVTSINYQIRNLNVKIFYIEEIEYNSYYIGYGWTFYQYSEFEPIDANNNYWHYVDNLPVVWVNK